MAGWYDTMRRRWGYNNIPSNQSNQPAPEAQQPTVEQPAQQPVQENTENQEVTPAKWFEDFYQKNMEQPITPEEQQKRVRGAQAAQAIGHLGNVLSSFSNLVFTDKGAPTQTIPSVPDLNIRSFEDRVAEKRRQYIAGQMAAREQDRKSVLDQFKMQLQQKDDDRKDKLNNARIKELESSDALNKEKEEYQKLVNAGYDKKLAAEIARLIALAEKARNEGVAAIIKAKNDGKNKSIKEKSGEKKKSHGKYRIQGPNGHTRDYDLDIDKDVIEFYRLMVKNKLIPYDKAESVNQMREAIKINSGKYIPGNSSQFNYEFPPSMQNKDNDLMPPSRRK